MSASDMPLIVSDEEAEECITIADKMNKLVTSNI